MTDIEPQLRKDLFTICQYWDDLLDLPRTAVARTTGRVEAPLPLPVGVLSFRREAGEQLAAWAHLLHEERDLHTALDLNNTVAVARYIDHHADYLAHHPAGRDAADEIGAIAARVTEFVKQTKAHRIIVGDCPDCEGKLVAWIRPADALLPSEVRCTLTHAHVHTPWEWNRLGERLRNKWDDDAVRRLVQSIASGT